MLVTGGADKALELWEVTSGRLLGQMQGHTSDIKSVAFTPNGRLIISASDDRSVRIWSLDHQQELAMLAFQKEGDEYAGIALDNRTLETAIRSAVGLRQWEAGTTAGSRTRRPVYWARYCEPRTRRVNSAVPQSRTGARGAGQRAVGRRVVLVRML